MYAFIKGEVAQNDENGLVIECSGLGYEIQATTDCVIKCRVGENVKIPTYLAISQDEVRLFGFSNGAEKSMFLNLIAISGIGPKVAIGILSSISVSDLALSIVKSDVKRLSKVKGLGKKTAERIILELKDKLKDDASVQNTEQTETTSVVKTNLCEDAVLALMTFGFTRAESETAVAKVQQDGMTTEQIIFKAMQIA